MSQFNKPKISQLYLIPFGWAKELASKGEAMSPESGDFIDRITGIDQIKQVPASQIWSPENRRIGALLKGPEGLIDVRPYLTKMTRSGIINYIPTNEDMNEKWMPSDYANRCISIKHDLVNDDVQMEFSRISSQDHLNHNLPFWMLYEQNMIGYHHNAIFIAGNTGANHFNSVIFNHLSRVIDIRNKPQVFSGFEIDEDFRHSDAWTKECDGNCSKYQHVLITENEWDIGKYFDNIIEPVNVFIDTDSLNELNLRNGENALEQVKGELLLQFSNPLINWVSFSIKEELQNSNNLREAKEVDSDADDAAHDESYVLKG